jgi:hypothetical protein
VAVPTGYTASGTTSRTVNVGSGGAAQANFALQAQGGIQGVVFDDLNGNGSQDAGEPGVGGVVLSRSGGITTTTESNGAYRFGNITPARYTVDAAGADRLHCVQGNRAAPSTSAAAVPPRPTSPSRPRGASRVWSSTTSTATARRTQANLASAA